MPFLDAILAFAITMLLVATVVTQCVNFLQWALQRTPQLLKALFHDRVALFEQMLNDFLTKELQAIARIEFGDDEKATAKGFDLNTLTQTLSQPTANGQKRNQLSNIDLVDKLKQTEFGKRLCEEAGARATDVFEEISRRYTAVEDEYSEIFRRNTRKVATFVALVVVLALNIDSFNILSLYINNPALSASVAARSEQALVDYSTQFEKVETVSNANETKQLLQELKAQQADIEVSLGKLTSGEIPFGWEFFPYGNEPPKYWSVADRNVQKIRCTLWVEWFLGILLTAGLAGLGSPFWYDVIRNVSQIARGGSSTDSERKNTE